MSNRLFDPELAVGPSYSEPAPGATKQWRLTFMATDRSLFHHAVALATCDSEYEARKTQKEFEEGKLQYNLRDVNGNYVPLYAVTGEYAVTQTYSSFNKEK